LSASVPTSAVPTVIVDTVAEPIAPGKFAPTWASLQQYKVPDWFRNAKFGIWAHWGPQCQPEQGDWYARHMYLEGEPQYKWHAEHYGPQSQVGFKEVIHAWKAEKWNPEKLVALYKRVGAQYFFALANHHDNLDLWDSRYQPWNSTKVGPRKDLIAGWAKAAKAQGLPFGVSVHAAHAWSWYEVAQGADKTGPFAGIAYDGKLTKADGKGQWWDGLDPQDLYEQRHAPSPGFQDLRSLWGPRWDWTNGVSHPDLAYAQKFYNRTMDLINKYQPDLIYFDDTALPLWPVSDAGLKIAAHFYNENMARHGGKLEAVLFAKVLNEEQRQAMVWDIERGVPATSLPQAWQTDTCIGGWHYQRSLYDEDKYKSAKTVVQMLADIVSKNGNLLLNIPVRGDGSIVDKEEAILQGIAAWMDENKECIFDTRPWKIFGEGPASDGAPITAQGFNEGKGKPFTADDVRYTVKGDALYVIVLGRPTQPLRLKHLADSAAGLGAKPAKIERLGSSATVQWSQDADALTLEPGELPASAHTVVYKLTGL
jgi:alpha-L-fucosidase